MCFYCTTGGLTPSPRSCYPSMCFIVLRFGTPPCPDLDRWRYRPVPSGAFAAARARSFHEPFRADPSHNAMQQMFFNSWWCSYFFFIVRTRALFDLFEFLGSRTCFPRQLMSALEQWGTLSVGRQTALLYIYIYIYNIYIYIFLEFYLLTCYSILLTRNYPSISAKSMLLLVPLLLKS